MFRKRISGDSLVHKVLLWRSMFMKKSKVLIGISMGILGCKFYDSFKDKLKPRLIKFVEKTISIGEDTKEFLNNAKETALELNKENYRRINDVDIKQNDANMAENIENLRKQLAVIQQQLSIL